MNASTSWNAQKGKICNAIARSSGIMEMSAMDNRMNVETLLKTIAQIPEDLKEILDKVRLIPSLITTLTKLEPRIMSSVADLQAKILELTSTVADEKAQVSSKINDLVASVESLKAAIVNQPEVDLSSEVAEIDKAIVEIRGFVEQPQPTPEAPVATPPDAAPVEPVSPVQ